MKHRGIRAVTHGGYCIRKPIRVHKYLTRVRKALIEDLGGTEDGLSAQQIILIDAVVDMLGVVKLMGEYVSNEGIMRGALLQPCLRQSYLTYRGMIHKHLALLGIKRQKIEKIMTPAELAATVDIKIARQKEGKK